MNKHREPAGTYRAAQGTSCITTHAPAADIRFSHLLKLPRNTKQTPPRTEHTVSSLHMEWIWVPNITAVKMKNRRPSRHRNINRITVIGGEKSLHSASKRKGAVTGHQSITNGPNGRMSTHFAHRRGLTVAAPGPTSRKNVLILQWACSPFTKGRRRLVLPSKISHHHLLVSSLPRFYTT